VLSTTILFPFQKNPYKESRCSIKEVAGARHPPAPRAAAARHWSCLPAEVGPRGYHSWGWREPEGWTTPSSSALATDADEGWWPRDISKEESGKRCHILY